MATLNWVNIALGYGLLLHGATPLLDPVMLYNQVLWQSMGKISDEY